MHTYCRQLQQLEEQKQQLEHYNATIQEEKDSLLQQNTSLTERLEAVVTEKRPCHQFDGQTPIDKTLDLLQNLILVGSQLKALAVHTSRRPMYRLQACHWLLSKSLCSPWGPCQLRIHEYTSGLTACTL